MIVYGINTVLEALRAGRVTALRVSGRADARIREVTSLAARQGIVPTHVAPDVLTRAARGGVHQGVVAEVEDVRLHTLGEIVTGSSPALVLVLDGIEDPHNVGAILRTADAAGVDGVVVQRRRAAALGGAAAKASAGALAHVKIAEVVNIARALEELKTLGLWVVGLAGEAAIAHHAVDLTVPMALVVGAEGAGLRRLVREHCDVLARIPMVGHVGSLNVSVAVGIAVFEALRQRGDARD
jgi:23S rRNA (guanosine2251-2'-O)-methyltransferase